MVLSRENARDVYETVHNEQIAFALTRADGETCGAKGSPTRLPHSIRSFHNLYPAAEGSGSV